MNINANFEHRAGSSQDKHEGESSLGLCDRLDRTRDNSQRQLPTDHDYAVPTREYQTDQSSPFLPRLLLALSSGKAKTTTKTTPLLCRIDTVTPYQANELIEGRFRGVLNPRDRLSPDYLEPMSVDVITAITK